MQESRNPCERFDAEIKLIIALTYNVKVSYRNQIARQHSSRPNGVIVMAVTKIFGSPSPVTGIGGRHVFIYASYYTG